MTTTQQSGDSGPPATINVISSAEALTQKVNTLLGVINTLSRIATEEENEHFVVSSEPVRKNAEEAFSYATAALNLILADRDNWNCKTMDGILQSKVDEVHEINMEAARARLALTTYHARPSVLLGCVLENIKGTFYASLRNGSMVGQGATAFAALDDLDAQLNQPSA